MITAPRLSAAARTLLRTSVAAGTIASLLGLAGCAGPGWKYRSLSVVPMEPNGQPGERNTIVRRNQDNRTLSVRYDGVEADNIPEGALRFHLVVESRDLLPYDMAKARFSLTARRRTIGDTAPMDKALAPIETSGPKARAQAALAQAERKENPHRETGWDSLGLTIQRMAGRPREEIENERRQEAEQANAWEADQKEELASLRRTQAFWESLEFSPRILQMGQRSSAMVLFPIVPEADTLILVTDCLGAPDSIRFLQTDPRR